MQRVFLTGGLLTALAKLLVITTRKKMFMLELNTNLEDLPLVEPPILELKISWVPASLTLIKGRQ